MGAPVGSPLIVAGIDLIYNTIMLKVPNVPEISANTPIFFRKFGDFGFLKLANFPENCWFRISTEPQIFPKIGAFGTSLTHWGLFLAVALRLTVDT